MTQVYGKLFTKEEAENQFGPVTFSQAIKSDEVKKLIAESPDNIMFKFVNNSLVTLNKNRQTIYGTFAAQGTDVFRNITTSVLNDLLVRGGQDVTQFQMRGDVFSIENGMTVLEMSYPCPPNC